MQKNQPPALQVLFEPWPDTDEGAWDRDGYEAFAGTYWLDALEPDGAFRDRGYRAMLAGCTTCRRDKQDQRAHIPNINDLKPEGPRRKCTTWKTIASVVKAFGGWQRVHYVALSTHEGLRWQSLQGRARDCWQCGGEWLSLGGVSQCATCRGFNVAAIGPKRHDRWSMTDVQRRMRV